VFLVGFLLDLKGVDSLRCIHLELPGEKTTPPVRYGLKFVEEWRREATLAEVIEWAAEVGEPERVGALRRVAVWLKTGVGC
jgi:hypothetical protein